MGCAERMEDGDLFMGGGMLKGIGSGGSKTGVDSRVLGTKNKELE